MMKKMLLSYYNVFIRKASAHERKDYQTYVSCAKFLWLWASVYIPPLLPGSPLFHKLRYNEIITTLKYDDFMVSVYVRLVLHVRANYILLLLLKYSSKAFQSSVSLWILKNILTWYREFPLSRIVPRMQLKNKMNSLCRISLYVIFWFCLLIVLKPPFLIKLCPCFPCTVLSFNSCLSNCFLNFVFWLDVH